MTANEGVGNEPIVNKKYGKNTQPGRGRVETKPYWREAGKVVVYCLGDSPKISLEFRQY